MILIIHIELYGFQSLSLLIILCLHTVIWHRVFLFNINNSYTIIYFYITSCLLIICLHTVLWYQVFLSKMNDLRTVIWLQVFLPNTNNIKTDLFDPYTTRELWQRRRDSTLPRSSELNQWLQFSVIPRT